MTAAHVVDPSDEERHPPDDAELWNESYYCDFVQSADPGRAGLSPTPTVTPADTSGDLWGGWLRLGLYPNRKVAWWTAWLVIPGLRRRLLCRLCGSRPGRERPRVELRCRGRRDRDRPAARGVPPARAADAGQTVLPPRRCLYGHRVGTDIGQPRPDLDDRRRAVPLRAHDSVRDPVHGGGQRDDR